MTTETPRQSFTTSSGNVYSFLHASPTTRATTLLFLHGFPSTSHDWAHQLLHFSSQGYGVIAPDLLGYGQTSRPSDMAQYRLRAMSHELAELLDHLSLPRVVGVGHDFGATLLSRFVAYFPTRIEALAFLAVGPTKLGTSLELDIINRMTKEMLGYELLGYIAWLARDPEAQSTLERHPEAAMSIMFCADEEDWATWFRPLGKMKQFVQEDRRVRVGEWYTAELRRRHLEAFGRKDGYTGAVRWYRMLDQNLSAPDEEGMGDFKISHPVLFVSGPDVQQEQMIKQWAPNLAVARMDSGHWMQIEKPDATNQAITQLLERL